MHLRECLSNLSDVTDRALRARADPGVGDRVEPIPIVRADDRRSFRPNRKLQPGEIDQLVADYLAGMCLTELGMKYSLHRQTAKAHLERRRVTIRSEMPSLTPEQVQAAGQLYEATGLSLAQVAARYEVAPNTLRRAIGQAGFRIRARGYADPRSR